MAWEQYKKTRRYSADEEITVSKSGLLIISPLLFENHFKTKTYADLFYDRARSLIGIKPLGKKAEYSYKVSRSGNGRSGIISGQSFLKTYKIPYKKTGRYKVKCDEGMVVFSVKSGQT